MERLNASETLDLISKQWAGTKDIQKLAQCGENKARQIKEHIKKEIDNWLMPSNEVPMSKLVEYLKIDIKYLKKVERSMKNETIEN